MSNRMYDILKWVALVVFPACSTCAIAILTALGYPHVEIVSAILVAIETCLGTILGASSISYYKKLSEIDFAEMTIDNLDEIDDGK